MLKSRPGGSRAYSPRRTHSPRKSSRNDSSQTTKSRPATKTKKRYRARDKADRTSYKKQDDKKGESSFLNYAGAAADIKPCFKSAWIQGAFSLLSLSMIQSVRLTARSALDMIDRPIAGRVSYCLDSWHKITCSKWVLRIVKDGY